jgi:hypothetical protein
MNHILIIILVYLALVFSYCFYEYYYKRKIIENFENNSNWDDKISLQVLRDILGVFFNESEKTFNIPGGLSVSRFFPALEISDGGRTLVGLEFARGTLDNGTRMRYTLMSLGNLPV